MYLLDEYLTGFLNGEQRNDKIVDLYGKGLSTMEIADILKKDAN